MLVYTYCSYKGSLKGYQYSFFDTSERENIQNPVISMEDIDKQIENADIVKKWFQNESGWKLVLKKTNETDKGILLLSKIGEETEVFRKENNISLKNMPEQIFFINIAFAGSIKKLVLIAAHYVNDLMYSEPYSCIWTKYMERFLEKTTDNEKYQLNPAECIRFLKEIETWAKSEKEYNKIKHEQNSYKRFNSIIKFLAFVNKFSFVRLKWEKNLEENCRERRKKVKEQIVNRLLQQVKYEEEYILLVSDAGQYEKMLKLMASMTLDIEYIRIHYILEE